ncbi:methyltransferase domain-containing protein [Burkholderia multivorans]|uniref:class I SAM-dependent methyltransferase n=1 Tax=Burkholderia ubonensis TaxID=101571 RepID=UPI000F6B8310|nr:class I SAM-dependent methyltransferase [Burkholderia ubonensis]AYZ62141.1 methyltransferase domain-containing protein [Burkholderia multivorans]VWB25981.1 cyclopropane fatty acyl phospholipid synthase [Burkholderia ubonensis]
MNAFIESSRADFERKVLPIWQKILSDDSVGTEANFFESGGHSLTAMLLVSRLEVELGIAVPLSELVSNPSVSSLAAYLARASKETAGSHEPYSIDGKETQIQYLLNYNNSDKQSARAASYEKYYAEALSSAAHAEFCRRVYGENFGQHGMADFKQLDVMLAKLNPTPNDRILDVGCGYGLIAEYLFDRTGAKITGIDLARSAIQEAQARVSKLNKPLEFREMDLQNLEFQDNSFNFVVSIDTIYFTRDLAHTLKQFRDITAPGAKIAIFRTFPKRSFTRDTWRPELTELAHELKKNFGNYEAIDFSAEENEHWAKKVEILRSLEKDFRDEGSDDLYKFRLDEAAYEAGIEQFRYLFISERK